MLGFSREMHMQKGINYCDLTPGSYSRVDSDRSLKKLRDTGAEWVAITTTAYQENIDSTTILTPPDKTLKIQDLGQVIDKAHDLGFKIMLKPHLDPIDRGSEGKLYHGDIGRNFDHAQRTEWFESYLDFILRYACLAKATGVEQFCVGTELKESTLARSDEWKRIVKAIRRHFDGDLTYAANSGELENGEVHCIQWRGIKQINYIGVDAYYTLRDESQSPSVDVLKDGWKIRFDEMKALSERFCKRILFTEVGFQSCVGSTVDSWEYRCGSLDLQEQCNAYEATFSMFPEGEKWFGGFYWYMWSADPYDGGRSCDAYTPHDKPAEDIIRKYYGTGPRPPQQPEPKSEVDASISENIFVKGLNPCWKDGSWKAVVCFEACEPGSEQETQAEDPVISVTLDKWGALDLYRKGTEGESPVDTGKYHWLEFKIRGLAYGGQHLWGCLVDHKNLILRKRPIDDYRYIEEGAIGTKWKLVRIPLSHLNAAGKMIRGVVIQDRCGACSTTFLIKDMRLSAIKSP
jgi:hypothetical protein